MRDIIKRVAAGKTTVQDAHELEMVFEEIELLRAEVEQLRRGAHPAITHCDSCGCDWLDNGLNPIGCPYCGLR